MSTSNVNQITLGPLNAYEVNVGASKMQIVHDFGCNLNFLTLNNQQVLDTNTKFEDLMKDYLCKSDLLAPFPNRVSDGLYTFEGQSYQLEKNEVARGHALHGLIIKKKFTMIHSDIGQDHISLNFETIISKEEFAGYPFDLRIEIKFTLRERDLTIAIKAVNIGNTTAPYGVGWHPYLTVGKKIDDCTIRLPASSELEVSTEKQLIPTGNKRHNVFGSESRTLGSTTFDTCFTDLVAQSVEFENIQLWWDPTMRFLQVYTPDDRMSIAVEPMSCAPDAYNNNMGLIVLKPNESVTHEFGIRVQ